MVVLGRFPVCCIHMHMQVVLAGLLTCFLTWFGTKWHLGRPQTTQGNSHACVRACMQITQTQVTLTAASIAIAVWLARPALQVGVEEQASPHFVHNGRCPCPYRVVCTSDA